MKSCPYCEGSIDLPHRTDDDCFRAVDIEMKATVQQLRTLTKRKGQLLRERVRARQRTVAGNARRRPSLLASRRLVRSKRRFVRSK